MSRGRGRHRRVLGNTIVGSKLGIVLVDSDHDASCDGREAGDRDEPDMSVMVPAEAGKPIPAGSKLCQLSPEGDGCYVVTEICRSDGGPAMVSSDAYRDGWDRIFGGGGGSGEDGGEGGGDDAPSSRLVN
jgi:hypothetical protein